ncbi:uncharacterized protein N0V89_004972 [Didymosphaeria variabile]|uniref:FAD/NAD(P)-binding domain-containing protein n=1 Tax=Didymosphaeria variabile TaxID=1932322 RepID=A0A9W8XJX9_9PLEO|nr:uncharacterized protein N0V89_004972 [Didymosphaeria variabile]KAJ4353245.1 hypothetical protein N0V89_004972 [Didymosphaeria variabile]
MGSVDIALNVIIVGAGFGGLAAAIECRERGMNVVIIERYSDSNSAGDIIDFFPNGGKIVKRWEGGNVGKELHEIGADKIDVMELRKFDGTLISNIPWAINQEHRDTTYAGHRGNLHGCFFRCVQRLGATIVLGQSVKEYMEKDDAAGVRLADGQEFWGDLVVAADGGRSIARQQVLGLGDEKEGSGWAIFRTFFDSTEKQRSHPDLKEFMRTEKDNVRVWMSDHLSMLAYSWNNAEQVAWVLMHPDDNDIPESWSLGAAKEDMLPWIKEFTSPEAQALFEITPVGRTIDFKLVYRPPLEKWTSKNGRIILIGDAAHCNLPTAGQGGSQAIEDALTLAYCLQHCNRDVPLATEITQRIRYHRSNEVHKSGKLTRDSFHKVSWDEIMQDPKRWGQKRFPHLRPHDALETVSSQFEVIKQEIESGKNGSLDEVAMPLPPGGIFMTGDH